MCKGPEDRSGKMDLLWVAGQGWKGDGGRPCCSGLWTLSHRLGSLWNLGKQCEVLLLRKGGRGKQAAGDSLRGLWQWSAHPNPRWLKPYGRPGSPPPWGVVSGERGGFLRLLSVQSVRGNGSPTSHNTECSWHRVTGDKLGLGGIRNWVKS